MTGSVLAGLRAHLARLLLTGLAIALGVGFVSGTLVLTDTMQAGFDRQFTASADTVSVAVLPKGSDSDIPADLLAEVRDVPGVADARPMVRGDAPLLGSDGRAYGDAPTKGVSIAHGALQRYTVVDGRVPTTKHQAVLDETVAERTGFGIGDTIRVLDPQGRPHAFTLVGIMDFGVDQQIGFQGAVGFTAPTATAMTGERGYIEIDVKARSGTGDAALRTAVAAAVGPSYDVSTGDELAEHLAAQSGFDMSQIRLFFLAFGLVALFVSVLVIYNTFNILIAQRTMEMALLRCVGATRGQVFRRVLLESVIVGLVASVVGVGIGLGLGWGGAAGFDAALDLPGGSLVVSPPSMVIGVLVGLAVTVASALLPARVATRVPPVSALVQRFEDRGGIGVVRGVVGVVLGAAGAALCGLAATSETGASSFVLVLAGAALVFLGVIALSPLVVRWLSGVIGWAPGRLFGVPGRLATANSRRNPRRAAVTTIALTVGVTLMTMFSVAMASGKATADAKLTEQFPVDYQLLTQFGSDQRVPREAARQLRGMSEFAEVIEVRTESAEVNGHDHDVGMIRADLGRTIDPKVVDGSLDDVRPGTVALERKKADALGVGVGRRLTLATKRGGEKAKVVAILADGTPLPSITVAGPDFRRLFGTPGDTAVYVVAKKGVSADRSHAAVDRAIEPYPMVKVRSAAEIKAQFTEALNQMFILVAALLGLAIVISLVGIANTLTLSVVERTRESALLRALGLTRRGLRRMLSLEAVIMALVGALLGVVLGTAFGWLAISAGIDGAVLGFPVGRVVAFVVIAAAAGVLAAVLPGRRAAKTSIVESLAAE